MAGIVANPERASLAAPGPYILIIHINIDFKLIRPLSSAHY